MKRERITITENLTRVNTYKQEISMQELKIRRFMYNSKTDELILGLKYPEDGKFTSSHDYDYYESGAVGEYDDFIRGWVGTDKSYPDGLIHFVPPLLIANLDEYHNAFSALEMFRDNGALPDTTVRAFLGKWEQPFSNILSDGRRYATSAEIKSQNSVVEPSHENEPEPYDDLDDDMEAGM